MHSRIHLSQPAQKRYPPSVRSVVLILMLVTLGVSAAPRPNNQNAKNAIEAALRRAAGTPEDIELTAADRLKVVWLGLAGKQISDLTPLANLPNLKQLWVHNNHLRELTSVAQLKNLEELSLDHNQFTELTPLAQCIKLRTLHLSNNRFTDVGPLANLKQLKRRIEKS